LWFSWCHSILFGQFYSHNLSGIQTMAWILTIRA
jgi:hypothetical protein